LLLNAAAASDDANALAALVRLAAPECTIERLAAAPQEAWPALAFGRRFQPTAENIWAYVEARDSVDEALATVLEEADTIIEVSGIDQDARSKLATQFVNANAVLPSATKRASLAGSLALEEPVDVDGLQPERGQLPGLLLQAGVIADSEQTFASRLMVDWATREFAIVRSRKIADFMSPDVLPVDEVAGFMNASLDRQLKEAVLSDLSAFLRGNPGAANGVARWAVSANVALDASQLEALQAAGTAGDSMISLLYRAPALPIDDMRALLRLMGAPYRTIADPGPTRPDVPDNEAHRALLERLRSANVVSSFSSRKGELRVSLRRH